MQTVNKTIFQQTKQQPTWLTSLGVILRIIWILTAFLQTEASIFLLLGACCLLFTICSRYLAKRNREIETGGGIFSFLLTWLVAQFFYEGKDKTISIFPWEPSVEEGMVFLLFIALISWFVIVDTKSQQEILFGLSPTASALLLNAWKLGILLEILCYFNEFEFLDPFVDPLFWLLALFDMVSVLIRLSKIDYADIILNPTQLLFNVLAGPFLTAKWFLLIGILMLLDLLPMNWLTSLVGLIAFMIGLICFTTSLTRLTLNSGVIESTVKEGRTVLPTMFDEIPEMEAEDFQFYEVTEAVQVRQSRAITHFPQNAILLRIPFSSDIGIFLTQVYSTKMPGRSGVWVFHTERSSRQSSRRKTRRTEGKSGEKKSKQREGLNISFKNFTRIETSEWEKILPKLQSLDRETVSKKLGISDPKKLDKMIQKGLQGTVRAQEQIRNRIRGVPAPTRQESQPATIQKGQLVLPPEIIETRAIEENKEVELVPGKGEFLFYVRAKSKSLKREKELEE